MKIADIMTAGPITVSPSDSIQQAEDIMEEHRIRQLPVVEELELVGILTDRDIRSFLSGHLYGTSKERQKALETEVGSVMTDKPLSLSPDDEIQEAIELLIEEKIGGIPVVDGENQLVGIVTYVDILRCFLEQLTES
jgi:CBS domain-containing protein